MDKETTANEEQKIIPTLIEEELKSSFLDYSMSVIVSRALPDLRDGLKPVHRRILHVMDKAGLYHNKPFRKCAFIVGRTIAEAHPHGDLAVYDSLVRMAQPFSLRYPLVDGQGNFGSIDGDSAAAMRYTEARLAKIAEEMLQDIDKETVDFQPNFDGSSKEPMVLPSKIPNILVNGSSGIAVGMATNIPPHNLDETCDLVIETIQRPDISLNEMADIVKGPDFPTGGLLCGRKGIMKAYLAGRSKIVVRARINIEEKKGKTALIITEIPFMINKSQLLEQIADLIRHKTIEGISGLRDESDRKGMRIVIELKKDASTDIVINQLYKHSRLQNTMGIMMLALVNNVPKVLNLKQIIQGFINHRVDIVTKRTQYDLKKAEERAHILEGLIIALNNIEEVIKKIRNSADTAEASATLQKDYELTDIQARAILDMRLQKLASLEQEKIKTEYEELQKKIEELKSVLASKEKVLNIIIQELEEIKQNYPSERRTEIIDYDEEEDNLEIEDLIQEEDVVVTVTHTGYIKRTPITLYKQQYRGGKGIIGTETKEEDFVEHLFIANTHSYLLIFTDKGQVYWLKVYKIPDASRYSKGKAIVNLLNFDKDEKISALIPVKEFDDQHYLIFGTKLGLVKKTNLKQYSRPRKGGIRAINLNERDDVIGVVKTNGSEQIIIGTKDGMAVRFYEKDVRSVGRNSMGVRGIRLRKGDEVIGMVVADELRTLLTITENGYGKRTSISDYRLINRGGKGVINIQTTTRNGKVVSIKTVTDEDELMLISVEGQIIRTSSKFISVIGRNTQGVRLMKLNQGDKVADAAKII